MRTNQRELGVYIVLGTPSVPHKTHAKAYEVPRKHRSGQKQNTWLIKSPIRSRPTFLPKRRMTETDNRRRMKRRKTMDVRREADTKHRNKEPVRDYKHARVAIRNKVGSVTLK